MSGQREWMDAMWLRTASIPSTRSPAVTFSKTKSGVTSARIASTSRAKNAYGNVGTARAASRNQTRPQNTPGSLSWWPGLGPCRSGNATSADRPCGGRAGTQPGTPAAERSASARARAPSMGPVAGWVGANWPSRHRGQRRHRSIRIRRAGSRSRARTTCHRGLAGSRSTIACGAASMSMPGASRNRASTGACRCGAGRRSRRAVRAGGARPSGCSSTVAWICGPRAVRVSMPRGSSTRMPR